MPGQGKYSYYSDTVGDSPFGAEGSKGVSNRTLNKVLFPLPTSGDQATQAGVAATANRELVPDVLPKNPDPTIYTADDIKLGFGASPDIEAGPFSGQDKAAGGPANPYFPNLASPGTPGNIDPVAPTPLKDTDVSSEATRDKDGLVDPSKLSAEMSNATKIGTTLIPGKHPGSK